jgi:hypothetical protein
MRLLAKCSVVLCVCQIEDGDNFWLKAQYLKEPLAVGSTNDDANDPV